FQAERFKEKTYSVLAGFRLERNSQYGFSAAPKVSAMYHLPKNFQVLGGGRSGELTGQPGLNIVRERRVG
ncbi:MAG: hypothetical protein LBF63_11920, partial [Treponema sp.]|nr:hypothetical protein [Treponema sp.]